MAPGKSHFACELESLSPMSLSRDNYFLKANDRFNFIRVWSRNHLIKLLLLKGAEAQLTRGWQSIKVGHSDQKDHYPQANEQLHEFVLDNEIRGWGEENPEKVMVLSLPNLMGSYNGKSYIIFYVAYFLVVWIFGTYRKFRVSIPVTFMGNCG